MIDSVLVEITLVPTRLRLAVMELLVKRLERIAVLYQHSRSTETKVAMPAVHSNALTSLKASISRDRALIAQRKGQTPTTAEGPTTIGADQYPNPTEEHPTPPRQTPKSTKQRSERDKRKSRRKSYMK